MRSSSANPPPPDSRPTAPSRLSIRTLLDSATLALPETTTFAIKRYRTRFSTDFIAQPTIGYQRDNFGRGVFGGTGISLSDMLGDRALNFAFQLNGRLGEAQFQAIYFDQSHRTNRAMGVTQTPNYYYIPSSVGAVTTAGAPAGSIFFTTRIRRLVVRDAFVTAFYTLNRFNRIEYGLHLVGMSDAILQQQQYFDALGRPLGVSNSQTSLYPTIAYVAPTIAFTHDNTLFGPVGPFAPRSLSDRPRRRRLEIHRRRRRHAALLLRAALPPLALRGLVFGRFGRDANQFPVVLGNPRSHSRLRRTRSSITSATRRSPTSRRSLAGCRGLPTGCPTLDRVDRIPRRDREHQAPIP